MTAALAAYAFARLNFPGRSWLFGIYLATLMIPSQVTLIPQFVLVAKLHGIDTWPGMILPHAFTALGVFLLRQFFLGIPRDYEEAARLDGANRWQAFIRVIVPLAIPAIATLAVFKFIGQWNNLLWPLVISNSDATRTAAVGLQVFQDTNGTQWNLLLMAATITTVPLIVHLLPHPTLVRQGHHHERARRPLTHDLSLVRLHQTLVALPGDELGRLVAGLGFTGAEIPGPRHRVRDTGDRGGGAAEVRRAAPLRGSRADQHRQ